MGPVAVVVLDILLERERQVRLAEDGQPVQASERMTRSATALAFGACAGVLTTSRPADRKTVSKLAANC